MVSYGNPLTPPMPEGSLPIQAGLDNLDQGVSMFDADLRLVACNRRFIELLGLPEALVGGGARFADLVRYLGERGEFGAGDLDDIVARRVKAAEHCTRHYSERTTLGGRILAAQTNPLPAGGFVTVYTDITERSLAETLTRERSDELEARVNQRTLELRTVNEELRRNIRRLEEASAAREKSEARLRLICDAIPAAIGYIDDELTLRFANRLFAEMVQRTSDQVVGRNARDIFSGEQMADLWTHIHRAFRGELEAFEYSSRRPDGREVISRNTLIPERGEDGVVLGLFVLALDVTEEKRTERAMHEAQKMSAIGQLAGGLAHDFNNLLTVIVGSLSSLKDRIDAELVGDYVAPAVRASHRGADITRRLLAFARQQSLEPLPVDVPGLIAGTAQMLRRSLPSTITIHCTAEAVGWPALVDPAPLENAVVNLALNARDAMADGGLLTFSTSYEHLSENAEARGTLAPGDYVKISVIDNGTGIAPEVQARILEPFFTTKPFGSGSGLGLSMVFGFVRQSGGDIRVDSEVGKGTCVTLLLPRAEGAVPVDMAADYVAVAGGEGELVLLVEDNEDVRQAVRRHLLELGYQVLEAHDGEDAQSLLSSVSDVRILVSDVIMPGTINGLSLADHARQIIPDIKIVLISGFANFAANGYDWFDARLVLSKPFGKDELARALERANP